MALLHRVIGTSLPIACAGLLLTAPLASASVGLDQYFKDGWDSPSWTFQPHSTIHLRIKATCDSGTMTATLYHERSLPDETVGGSPTFPCDGQWHDKDVDNKDLNWGVQGGGDNHYHLHFTEHHGSGTDQAHVQATLGEV
jgi:hypothetical protein